MANRKKKRRKARQHNALVLRLLILVVLVLVVFEGKLIHTMFTVNSGGPSVASASPGTDLSEGTAQDAESETDEMEEYSADSGLSSSAEGSGASDIALAGLTVSGGTMEVSGSGADTDTSSDTQSAAASSEQIDDDKVVPMRDKSVDDSYFQDAVFIGDSRMEGFRNTSGITQGTFLTSVGMTLTSISSTKVQTADGSITVYQGLSGRQYGKIYLMLGTNDLGFYPMEEFLSTAIQVLETFHELQPSAVIYVCSVIYVEEAKVTTSYVNNTNVQLINDELLKACDQLPWCYYINLNEILSDGNHSLIYGASEDGVHLYADYSKLMLDYLKSHYIGS